MTDEILHSGLNEVQYQEQKGICSVVNNKIPVQNFPLTYKPSYVNQAKNGFLTYLLTTYAAV